MALLTPAQAVSAARHVSAQHALLLYTGSAYTVVFTTYMYFVYSVHSHVNLSEYVMQGSGYDTTMIVVVSITRHGKGLPSPRLQHTIMYEALTGS